MANVKSLNRVILLGRVGKEPEITHIPSLGKDVAKFSLATNEGYMDKNNQWVDTTEWHNIVAWDWNAKKVERNLSKGAMVLIEGKIKTRKWQDKESGVERRITEIFVDNLVPLEKQNREGSFSRETSSRDGGYSPNNSFNSGPGGEGYQIPPEVQIDDIPYDNPDDPF